VAKLSLFRRMPAPSAKPNRRRRPAPPAASTAAAEPEDERVVLPRNKPRPLSTSARPVKAAYFNRELSWLAFNRRVLEQAQNAKIPLLERVKFLAIVCSNLDEFFEIRVAGLIQQVDSDVTENSFDGL